MFQGLESAFQRDHVHRFFVSHRQHLRPTDFDRINSPRSGNFSRRGKATRCCSKGGEDGTSGGQSCGETGASGQSHPQERIQRAEKGREEQVSFVVQFQGPTQGAQQRKATLQPMLRTQENKEGQYRGAVSKRSERVLVPSQQQANSLALEQGERGQFEVGPADEARQDFGQDGQKQLESAGIEIQRLHTHRNLSKRRRNRRSHVPGRDRRFE